MKIKKYVLARAVKIGHNDWVVRRGNETLLNDIGLRDVAIAAAKVLNRPSQYKMTWNRIFSILVHDYGFTPREVLRTAQDNDYYDYIPDDPELRQRREETGNMILADADDHLDDSEVIENASKERRQ